MSILEHQKFDASSDQSITSISYECLDHGIAHPQEKSEPGLHSRTTPSTALRERRTSVRALASRVLQNGSGGLQKDSVLTWIKGLMHPIGGLGYLGKISTGKVISCRTSTRHPIPVTYLAMERATCHAKSYIGHGRSGLCGRSEEVSKAKGMIFPRKKMA